MLQRGVLITTENKTFTEKGSDLQPKRFLSYILANLASAIS